MMNMIKSIEQFFLNLVKEIPAPYRIYGAFFVAGTIGIFLISKCNFSKSIESNVLTGYFLSTIIINVVIAYSRNKENHEKIQFNNKLNDLINDIKIQHIIINNLKEYNHELISQNNQSLNKIKKLLIWLVHHI